MAVFIFKGVLFAALTPPWQAPDEPANIGAVAFLAHDNSLGPSINGVPNAIYRSVVRSRAADLIAWAGTPPPAAGSGVTSSASTPDFELGQRSGNVSIYNAAAVPLFDLGAHWGILGAMYALRFLDILFGALAVAFAYLLAKEARLGPPNLPALAAIVVAFVPQFGSITASVNKDPMAAALGCAALWMIARVARRGVSLRRLAAALGVIGLGAATKLTLLALVLPLAVTAAVAVWASPSPRRSRHTAWWAAGLLAPLAGVVALSMVLPARALDYIRVLTHSHLGPVLQQLTQRQEVSFMVTSSWGNFGWLNAPLNAPTYRVLFVLMAAAAAGVAWFFIRRGGRLAREDPGGLAVLCGLISAVLAYIVVMAVGGANGYGVQGRFWFPAIGAFAVLFCLGLTNLVPSIRGRYGISVALVLASGFNLLILLRQFPDRFGIL